ncbi:Translin [Coniophora puteana RWD-64-598 SS2]|uniref:Translin n=1 Tax=Coniophora puteana (strain RWD-64-598) TaxID=741705 RepID=A0A5M3N6F0_CONPW|nr:Translin [Coniophora puteana RWD-64-598 SS2]EIW86435.1 Translin [Coniophora puteana RWD-64-598 SS2]
MNAPSQSIRDVFDGFRQELDDYNDRRERLIKSSRDITNLSKKVIFLLHRLVLEEDEPVSGYEKAVKQALPRLREIQEIFFRLKGEIQGANFWHHRRSVSPGLQEYIEALSFAHYLEHGTLITFAGVQATLADASGVPYFPLPKEDYLLDFDRFTPHIYELSKKQHVTAQSLEKIETGKLLSFALLLLSAVYSIVVRGSEFDLPQEVLDDIIARSMSTVNDGSTRSKGKDVHDRANEDELGI